MKQIATVLLESQIERLNLLSETTGKSRNLLIREAVNIYLHLCNKNAVDKTTLSTLVPW